VIVQATIRIALAANAVENDLRVHEQSVTRSYKIPVFELKVYAANG